MLDKPISSVEKRDFIVEGLTELLKGDHSCTNPARIFFGTDGQTKKVTVVNANATITLDDVIRIYKPSSPNNYNKNDELMQMVHEFDFLGYISKEYEVIMIVLDSILIRIHFFASDKMAELGDQL